MQHEHDERRKPPDGIGNKINVGRQDGKDDRSEEFKKTCGRLKTALVYS